MSILNLFLYQIDSFPLIKLDERGSVVIERYYYSRLVSNQSMVLAGTVIVSLSSYLPFVSLIILNVFIYIELRNVIARRKKMIGQTSYAFKTDENSSRSAGSTIARGKASGAGVGGEENGSSLTNDMSLKNLSRTISNNQVNREAQEKKSLRRSLIITLYISLIFSSDRLIKCVYRSVVLVMPLSRYTFYLNAISYIFDTLAYSSFFFVYMSTNKIFKRKFYEIFFRKKDTKVN